jgi:hypothetical protein
MPFAEEQDVVQALTPKRACEPLGKCIRPRRPDGDLDHSGAVAEEDAVECGGEFAVPVADQELEPPGPLAEVHEQVPRLLGGPGPGRMRSDAQDVHGPGLDLQHEQHIQTLQQHRVHMQEVTREDARGLGGQELPPRRRRPPWRRAEPGGGQDPVNRPFAHPVLQAQQLALDPPVPPTRVLPRQLLHQRAHLVRDRRASLQVRVGPFPLDQAPVPGQQRAWCHDPVQPQLPGQQPG